MKIKHGFVWLLAAAMTLAACSDSDTFEEVTGGDDSSSEASVTVVEYLPAPGQFINENMDCTTPAEAAAWAQAQLDANLYVSLGAFGGSLTVKMPAPVKNRRDYDFGVVGNPFDGSSEPGIVWVSEDVNGNGVADDPWYELAGGDDDALTRGYEVTYSRPTAEGDIEWTDNNGGSGQIKYLPQFHAQMYYPKWVAADSYTLKGSLLPPNNRQVNGIWRNEAYSWGYADNMGGDVKQTNNRYGYNRFNLDDAVDAAGNKVVLEQIHFVKVQSAVLSNVPLVGEVSTEVCGFKIY